MEVFNSKDGGNFKPEMIPSAPALLTPEKSDDEDISENHHTDIDSSVIKPFSEKQLLFLYKNEHVRISNDISEEFLSRESGLYFANCPLIELLNEYLRSQLSFRSSQDTLRRLQDDLEEKENLTWTLTENKVENEGVCHDKVKVVSIHKFKVATFNSAAVASCSKIMKETREESFEHYSLCLYKTSKLKTRIDDYLNKICQDAKINREVIKTSLSVLFSFQRKLINNEIFVQDTRSWIQILVNAMLSTQPDFSDHVFLFNHILRCPGGVGHWAHNFIQIPPPIFENDSSYLTDLNLQQCVALLAVLFSPVKGRKEMLREYCVSNTATKSTSTTDGNTWTVLDSDGEDDDLFLAEAPLRENDYVSIFNQFPLEALFKYLFKIEPGMENNYKVVERFSTTSFFKLFAFGTYFVNLLKGGLQRFSKPCYRQFAKRIGRLIKHTLQNISDHWNNFSATIHQNQIGSAENQGLVDRIEVEYNNFFLRAVKSIFYADANAGMWQYLASVPYSTIKEEILWHAYAIYHFSDEIHLLQMRKEKDFCLKIKSTLSNPDRRASFEDTLSGLPDTEVMFLLTTFANMAIARDYATSKDFICSVVSELVSIGFLNELTSDQCAKGCRDLLSNLSKAHPPALSFLVHLFSSEPKLIENSTSSAQYISREMMFFDWNPTDEDFQILGSWLKNRKLDSNYSHLSRIIFSKMNWRALPWDRSKYLAILIVETSAKFAPDSIAGNFLQDSVRQVSHLAHKLRKTPEQVFTAWAWEMCSRLRLHQFDRDDQKFDESNQDDNVLFVDLDLDAVQLGEAVATKNPLACFVALQLSQTGQVVDDFLERGLSQLMIVTSSSHFDHVLECMSNLTPYFFDQSEMLCTSEIFLKIVQQIVSMDHTYLRMAMVADFPGPVLKEFVNMIAYQMENYTRYNRRCPMGILKFWLQILVHLPGWMSSKSALFVIEFICKSSVGIIGATSEMKKVFKEIDTELLSSSKSGFFSWLSGSKTTTTLLTPCMSEFPWTAFFILEVEEDRDETELFWKDLVDELGQSDMAGASLDKIHKKILLEKKFPEHATNLNSLPIYKWCQLILDGPTDHPLLMAFAIKFFKYFSAKSHVNPENAARVGHYFFEGVINTHYFGRIVTKFKTIEDHYQGLEDENSGDLNLTRNFKQTFHAFGLWLKDMAILDDKLHLPSLAPNMLPDLLIQVFQTSKKVDLSFMDPEELARLVKINSSEWRRLHFRNSNDSSISTKNSNRSSPTKSTTPPPEIETLMKRLAMYDSPTPFPVNKNLHSSVIPLCDTWFCDTQSFENTIGPYVYSLQAYGKNFDELKREYGSLMFSIMELVNGLYINVDTEFWTKGSCIGTVGPQGQKFECSGSAAIMHKFCEAQLQPVNEAKLNDKRQALTKLMSQVTQPMTLGILAACTLLEDIVDHLLRMYFKHLSLCPGRAHSPALVHYHQLGVKLFYMLFDCLGEETSACPILRHLLSTSFENLGQAMISDHKDECLPLLQRICCRPELASHLSAIFTPGCCDSETFLRMYRMISDMSDSYSSLAFTLLSKMNVEILSMNSNNAKNLSKLLSLIGNAFKRTGVKVTSERQLIHDLHRQHLVTLLKSSFQEHYSEVISMLLNLTNLEVLDANIWMDIINSFLPTDIGKLGLTCTTLEIASKCSNFALVNKLLDLEEVETCMSLLEDHFKKERRSVGLHGLYSKYRRCTVPLAAFMSLNSCCFIKNKILSANNDGNNMENNNRNLENIFVKLTDLFEPWIIPLMQDQRQEAAAWIQQFAESSKVLFPWAPNDIQSAEVMLSVYSTSITFLDKTSNSEQKTLSYLLELYNKRFVAEAMKDFVLNPLHTQFVHLHWSEFIPDFEDLGRIVNVLDTFNPLCHEFIGKIFVKFNWISVFSADISSIMKMSPYFLHCVVKLSVEPEVRKNGDLLKLLDQVPNKIWEGIGSHNFENLMQWHVMSCDTKVILLEDCSPIDVKILSILRLSSDIDSLSNDQSEDKFSKAKVFIKCFTKMLSSCGSKHKNYISKHPLALEKTVQGLVDDLGDLIIKYKDSHPKECEDLMRCILPLMNSNSIIPNFLQKSINECWLAMTDHQTALIFIQLILSHASLIIASPDILSDVIEDCLEAFFLDRNDDDRSETVHRAVPNKDATWNLILPMIKLPKDKEKNRKCLERAVNMGHCLLLFSSLRITRSSCLSIKDEQVVLLSTLLDWFRHLELNENSERKLPLLFREMITLCARQISCGTSDPTVVQFLQDFMDVIAPLLELDGSKWNILGVLGLSSKYKPPPRSKFLALALTFYIQRCLVEGPKIRLKSNNTNETMQYLNYDQMKKLENELEMLLKKPGYFGLSDNIEWVLKVTRDSTNTFEDADNFLSYIVCDNLFTESFHSLK